MLGAIDDEENALFRVFVHFEVSPPRRTGFAGANLAHVALVPRATLGNLPRVGQVNCG